MGGEDVDPCAKIGDLLLPRVGIAADISERALQIAPLAIGIDASAAVAAAASG